MRRRKLVGSTLVGALVLALGLGLGAMAEAPKDRLVTAWGSSMQGPGPATMTVSDATVQMIARSTLAGSAVRVRLENTFGAEPLTIGETYVGLRNSEVSLVEGSNRQLTFGGQPSVTIPAGGRVWSDAVALEVEAQQDLAVSLYLPGTNVPITRHNSARTTSYLTPNGAGNHAAAEDRSAFTLTTTSMLWLSAVDVLAGRSASSIVFFGDSITDGSCSTLEAHDRWEDLVAVRLALGRGKGKSVVNEGIGGNTVTREGLVPPPSSPPGIERLDRDVLELSGVSNVVLFMGTNDIRREASAAQLIAGYEEIIRRVKAAGPKIIGVTIIPRHNRPPEGDNTGWNDAKTAIRNEVNEWIRTRADFDAVLDFDKVVRDPADPDLINPIYNCDGIHPNPFGYFNMGKSVDLHVFK
jgi:lysophospholipase L1-like esterase